MQAFQTVDNLQIIFISLTKTHARIQNDPVIPDSRRFRYSQGFRHIRGHVLQKISVVRLGPVMHQAAGQPALSYGFRHLSAVVFQSPYIINQICTRLYSRPGHLIFIGIQRNRDIKTAFDRLYYRNHPFGLFIIGNPDITRPGGLPSDIQDVHAILYHSFHMPQRSIQMVVFSSIRKGIRRNVQDSHNICLSSFSKLFSAYIHIFSLFFLPFTSAATSSFFPCSSHIPPRQDRQNSSGSVYRHDRSGLTAPVLQPFPYHDAEVWQLRSLLFLPV